MRSALASGWSPSESTGVMLRAPHERHGASARAAASVSLVPGETAIGALAVTTPRSGAFIPI